MSWPHIAYLVGASLVVVFAVATAWRFGSIVVPQNRIWTRAWLIVVAGFAVGPHGWLVPFGAVYVIARYGRVWRRSHVVRDLENPKVHSDAEPLGTRT